MSTTTQVASEAANLPSKENKPTHQQNPSVAPMDLRCPDPSAHQTKDSTLQDRASVTAMHGAKGSKESRPRNYDALGSDGKLSSAGAAASLKYARANDLPSFPTIGIEEQNSGLTAATLAHSNPKSPAWPKPEKSDDAGKAALLAHDYKMQPTWKPEASAAGSKAALLAHRDGVKSNHWYPEASADGNSAANIAMRNKGKTPGLDSAYTDDVRKKALIAATGAFATAPKSTTGRRRAQSTPTQAPLYPDSENSARNALSAATIAHSPSIRSVASPKQTDSDRLASPAMEAARIQHSRNTSREMYSSHPPVSLEIEERSHQNALRASAISMAKQMYDLADHQKDDASMVAARDAHAASTTATGQHPPGSEADIKQQALRFISVQEAAQKLAAERLAKIDAKSNADFRSYYGYPKPRARLSIRNRRGRSSSDPQTVDSDDEMQALRVRSQMSQLNKSLAELDTQREQDRKKLLEAAQRKVHAQMQGIDQKIYNETGKMSPAMIEEWDAKARARAAAASEERMANHGKVHIGGGKYIDQSDIDAVAAARIQPTLDEIAEKTEKRKAEEEEARLDAEEKKRQERIEKERAAELKAEEKKVKDEEKRALRSRNEEEKAAARQEKEAEKFKKSEEKRLAKESKRKSKVGTADTDTDVVSPASPTTGEEEPQTPAAAAAIEPGAENRETVRSSTPVPQTQTAESNNGSPVTSPTSPTSPSKDSKGFKSLLNKLRRRSRHSATSADADKPGFIKTLGRRGSSAHSQPAGNSTSPTSPTQAESSAATRGGLGAGTYSDVSSLDEEEGDTARGRGAERMITRDSVVSEGGSLYEDASPLAPPPQLSTIVASGGTARAPGSPVSGSRFREIGI